MESKPFVQSGKRGPAQGNQGGQEGGGKPGGGKPTTETQGTNDSITAKPEVPDPCQPKGSTGGTTLTETPRINSQKQAGHVKDTPQYLNRLKTGKPTSTWDNPAEADALTLEAYQKGIAKEISTGGKEITYEIGRRIGTGPYGGAQTQVRVIEDANGDIHGSPWGPEK